VSPSFSIRPLASEQLDDWLRLRNRSYPWAADRERFLFSESLRLAGEPVLQVGAWTAAGELAGTAECYVGEDGERWVDRAAGFVTVAAAYRRQGLGARLADEVDRFAAGQNVRWLEALLLEHDLSTAEHLLSRRGFSEMERYLQSAQQPATVSLASLDNLRAKLTASGIETVAFSWIDSDQARRSLYRCAMEVEHDMPHQAHSQWHDPPFETWSRNIFEAPRATKDAIFVARDGSQIVGVSYLVFRGNGEAEVGDTGVVHSHRRRGIARALKLMATRYAAEHGIPRVHTDNRSDNAGMLALNTELGFRPTEAIVIFEKTLSG
jgi:GNAT superfamily N-acetyltransferase